MYLLKNEEPKIKTWPKSLVSVRNEEDLHPLVTLGPFFLGGSKMKIKLLRGKNGKADKDFSIAEDGSYIRNKRTGRKLVPYFDGKYMVISIKINGIYHHHVKISHLQWLAWKGEIPKGYVIHHNGRDKDGEYDSTNDHIDNLQCITRSKHRIIHNTGNKYGLGYSPSEESLINMRIVKLGKRNPMWGKWGEDDPYSKLTNEDVEEIRHLRYIDNWTQVKIADKIGRSKSCIGHVLLGHTWNPDKFSAKELREKYLK